MKITDSFLFNHSQSSAAAALCWLPVLVLGDGGAGRLQALAIAGLRWPCLRAPFCLTRRLHGAGWPWQGTALGLRGVTAEVVLFAGQVVLGSVFPIDESNCPRYPSDHQRQDLPVCCHLLRRME